MPFDQAPQQDHLVPGLQVIPFVLESHPSLVHQGLQVDLENLLALVNQVFHLDTQCSPLFLQQDQDHPHVHVYLVNQVDL